MFDIVVVVVGLGFGFRFNPVVVADCYSRAFNIVLFPGGEATPERLR